MAAHILANVPKGYRTIKKIIKMDDNYLNDLEAMQKNITKHWKNSYRKKNRKGRSDSDSYSSDSSDSSSDSSEDEKHRSRKKTKDRYALNVKTEQKDTYNCFGTIMCGFRKKPGHGIKDCWSLNETQWDQSVEKNVNVANKEISGKT